LFGEATFSLQEAKADPDDIRATVAERLLVARTLGSAAHIAEGGDEVIESVDKWVHGESYAAVPTGIPSLDIAIGGGWIKSGVGIIGGRRGSAKTAFAMQMLINGAKAGHAGMMISLEMTREQLLLRYVTRELGVKVSQLRAGKMVGEYSLVEKVRGKVDEIAKYPVYICDASELTLYQLNDLIRLQVLRSNLEIVYVDYAELINVPGEDGYGMIKSVYKTFKATAKKHGIAIVVLSQLGRSIEHSPSKFPDDSALKFAGEDEGDTILLLWNVAGYQNRGITVEPPAWLLDGDRPILEPHPEAEGLFREDRLPVIISKSKWGNIGGVSLGFDMSIGKIYDPVIGSRISGRRH
jgi:replicative DNA helicase